ncbi:MAG: hypothetical protein M1840_008319 [Geoglossum simile]|nr:MAG: hypothetical protein M1840_008319 [Geoglossum simile]
METAPASTNGPLRVLLNRGGCDAFESGIKSLLVLQRLMYYIRPSDDARELPRPCEVFNCIVGNGSGGILALLLGCFQLVAGKCLAEYINLLFWLQRKEAKKGSANTTTVLAKFMLGSSDSSKKLRSEIMEAAPPVEEWGPKLLQSPRYIFEHFQNIPHDGKPSGSSRSNRLAESLREFDQIPECNLDLCFSTKSLTQASLVRWVRLTLLLNSLDLGYLIPDCLTLVSTSKDLGAAGYTPRNAETLQRFITALIGGDIAYYGPTNSLRRMTEARRNALAFELLKEHSSNRYIELLIDMGQCLHPPEPAIHCLFDGLRLSPGGSYHLVPVPALEFGSKYLKQVATSSENIHEAVKNQFAAMGYSQGLFRYSVPKEYDMNVELDDYKKYSTIKDSTVKYLSENAVQEQMVQYSQIFDSNQSVKNPGHIDLPNEQQVHLSPEERSRIQCEIKADVAAHNPTTYPIEALEFYVGIARFSSVDDFHDDPDTLNQGFGKVVCTIPLRQGDSDGEAHSPRVVWQLPHFDPGNFLISWLVKLVHEGTGLGSAEDPKKPGPLAELKSPISPETSDRQSAALPAEAPETASTPTADVPDPAPGTAQEQTPPPEPISVPLEFSATEESPYQSYSEGEEATPPTHYQHVMRLSHQWEAVGGDKAEPLFLRGGGKIKFAISLEESRIPADLALLLGGISLTPVDG